MPAPAPISIKSDSQLALWAALVRLYEGYCGSDSESYETKTAEFIEVMEAVREKLQKAI